MMTNKAGFLFLVVLINAIHTYALPHDTIDEFIIPLRGRDNVDATVIKGQGAAANNVTTLAIVLRGFEECEKNSRKYGTNVDWKNWIIDGFKEHDTMSMGQWVLRPNRNSAVWGYRDLEWNGAAEIEFFGPGYKNKAYREDIQDQLDQHANMEYAWFLGWTIHVRCDDPLNDCLDRATGIAKKVDTEAYTITGADDDTCQPYVNHINFCPNYFKLPTLADAMTRASQSFPRRNFLREYWNRACVWAHEAMHIDWLARSIPPGESGLKDVKITVPPRSWRAYSTIDTKYLSYSELTDPVAPFNNPQNYAYFLLAKYVQEELDWYPSQNVWSTNDEPPTAPPRRNGPNNAACRPTALGGVSTATGTKSTASAASSCFVPAGCTNLAAPTACAVVCT